MNPNTEPADVVLEELHETRRRLLQRHGGVAGLAAYLREQERKSDRKIRSAEAGPKSRAALQQYRE